MEDEIGRERFQEILSRFAGKSVLVIGDLMVDEYLTGSVRRISQESPVMVVEVEADEFKPGGAANVGNNLMALGANVSMAGVVGNDEGAGMLLKDLRAWNIDTSGIFTDDSRPTTRKTRIIAQNQQVLRVDREQTNPISEDIGSKLQAYIQSVITNVDAILVSDYRKGVLTKQTSEFIVKRSQEVGISLVANSKPGGAAWLGGATVVSLNRSEAEDLARRRIVGEVTAQEAFGAALRAELNVNMLVITWGSRGLSYWKSDGEYRYVPAHRVEVADVAGAGDTTISAMTLSLLSGASSYEAAVIANRSGACVVRKAGVATVTVEELLRSPTDEL